MSAFFPAARNENRGQLDGGRPFRAILARERTWLGQSAPPLTNSECQIRCRREADSNLYGAFPVKSCFGLLPVLCSERESCSSSRRLRSSSRSARKASRDRNASKAWRLAA